MNRPMLRLLAAAAMLAALSGCASLSRNECLAANWEDIGIRDGANGRPEEYLIQHSTACAKVNVVPDRGAWLQGRERGLERFCEPRRIYGIGESGGSFDAGICRNFDQGRLVDAYEKGRDVYRVSSDLGNIDSEIRGVRARLEEKEPKKELTQKEREQLAYRLGQLEYERLGILRALEDARYRARDL